MWCCCCGGPPYDELFVRLEMLNGFFESRGSVPTGRWLGAGGRKPALLRTQSSALLLPPGVAGEAIEAGLPRLAMLRPPPGVAGLRMLLVSEDSMLPPGLPASPSEPLVLPLVLMEDVAAADGVVATEP